MALWETMERNPSKANLRYQCKGASNFHVNYCASKNLYVQATKRKHLQTKWSTGAFPFVLHPNENSLNQFEYFTSYMFYILNYRNCWMGRFGKSSAFVLMYCFVLPWQNFTWTPKGMETSEYFPLVSDDKGGKTMLLKW
jgi:hypothetical protein